MLSRFSQFQRVTCRCKQNSKRIGVRWHAGGRRTTKSDEVEHLVPKALAIGSLAGVCGSLVGLGGGFVMIPMMTSFLRLSQHQAHGTSLFAVTTTGIAGALGYSGKVDYEAAAAIAATGMITARFGAIASSRLSERVLRKALGVSMICVAPMVPAKTYFKNTEKETPNSKDEDRGRLILPALIGSFSGFQSGLFGVGGGSIVVPALTLFTDLDHYQALGTSLCAMAFPAMSGTWTHYGKGNVALRVAPFLAGGAFIGAYLGGKLGLTIEEDKLRWGFSGLMVVLGARTLVK